MRSAKNKSKMSAAICAAKPTAASSPNCTAVKPYSRAKGAKSSALTLAATARTALPAKQARAAHFVFPMSVMVPSAVKEFHCHCMRPAARPCGRRGAAGNAGRTAEKTAAPRPFGRGAARAAGRGQEGGAGQGRRGGAKGAAIQTAAQTLDKRRKIC